MRWPLRWTKKGVLKAEKSIPVKRSKHKFVEWKRMRWKLVKGICTRRKSLAERNQSFPLFSDLNWVENVQRLRNIHEKWNFIVSIQNISSQSLAADKLIFQRFDRCWTESYTITSFSSCDVKTGPKNKNGCLHFELTRNVSCSISPIGPSLGTRRDRTKELLVKGCIGRFVLPISADCTCLGLQRYARFIE